MLKHQLNPKPNGGMVIGTPSLDPCVIMRNMLKNVIEKRYSMWKVKTIETRSRSIVLICNILYYYPFKKAG